MTNLTNDIYLVLEVTRYAYNPETRKNDMPRDFRVASMRKSPPALESSQVAVKLRLNVDSSMFQQYIPIIEATIEEAAIVAPIPTVQVFERPATD